MTRKLTLTATLLALSIGAMAWQRHWTCSHGLPTGEVRQILELPNGQMLVNCEGVFCLSNGKGFDPLPCDYGRTLKMSHYADGYGRLWQGDSLLWLHDFYHVYLFDARSRSFRYDIAGRIAGDELRRFVEGEVVRNVPDSVQWARISALGLAGVYGSVAADRQGGLWVGTLNDGIVYVSAPRDGVTTLESGHPLIGMARSSTDALGRTWHCHGNGLDMDWHGSTTHFDAGNVRGLPYSRTSFICQTGDGRYLLCDSLATLGYFDPERRTFRDLTAKLPQLLTYRRLVGACPIGGHRVAVYSQHGAFVLDTQTDTLAPLPAERSIISWTEKYNCMLLDADGTLWTGTQNGLFRTDGSGTHRIDGLANNCIRSLVADARGRIWAGTSQGVARVTPSVLNLGPEDGIPAVSPLERASCLAPDGKLVFALGGHGLMFDPDSVAVANEAPTVVVTTVGINNADTIPGSALRLTYRQNYVSVRFSTLDYAAPSHTTYRYRLHPMERQWTTSSDGSGQGVAAYTALAPGRYTFEVQATSAMGDWGEVSTLEINIAPPLWLTWWAKTAYALAGAATLACLTGLYIRQRRKKLERDNEERVNRLFELRDEARHQFAQTARIDADKVERNEDDELVERLQKAIAQNMGNADYTVEQLARDVAMSRASLYKKTSVMLGITPNDFLRNMRLKRAAELLTQTNEPVGQVALAVGFQTARYFSQCFRQMFGMTPTEYRTGRRNA